MGITRAKKHTWVLYDEGKPSPFVKEFMVLPEEDKAASVNQIPESERCPKCHCGRVITTKKGVAVNGNPYSVVICSNQKYGCDYMETLFLNLNAKHYPPKRRRIGFQ